MSEKQIKKIVLAYSGGLDTTVILHWLKDKYDAEVIAFTADIGQDHDPDLVRDRAASIGASKIIIEDLKEEFTKDYIFPMFKANTLYEGEYLLGTSIARPLISKRLVEIAEKEGADAIAHGATGKGNDQIRFEIGSYSLNPDIQVIAPWRTWEYSSRADLVDYCKLHQIEIDASPDEPLYSTDENLLHTSYEGEVLEDPSIEAPAEIWQKTVAPIDAPDTAQVISIDFKQGEPTSIDGIDYNPSGLLAQLNTLAGKHGIGRLDLVENRFTGMKSRGCYETPGGTILLKAHRAIESITLDSQAGHLKDDLMPKYAQLIYDGFWWSPEREALQALIDKTQEFVTGSVKLSLYKGNVAVLGRSSDFSLYDSKIVTFEDDENAYNQADATGFIKINSLRLKQIAKRKRRTNQ
ncbi:argininosuccinate synthase [Gammaproteobacteria bacterium]|nr:argininosuccinate synthase [Gammaproteobacteria bacterium]MDC0576942.1 argininosuccinate synthase [Gammaproteobacteria bacterium]MDC3323531.1 argininosuccinate synthase [Gammaproteobacteria bacterium]